MKILCVLHASPGVLVFLISLMIPPRTTVQLVNHPDNFELESNKGMCAHPLLEQEDESAIREPSMCQLSNRRCSNPESLD